MPGSRPLLLPDPVLKLFHDYSISQHTVAPRFAALSEANRVREIGLAESKEHRQSSRQNIIHMEFDHHTEYELLDM